jgi:hypothetical protein
MWAHDMAIVYDRALSQVFISTNTTRAAVGGGGSLDAAQRPGRGTAATGTPRSHSRANRVPAVDAPTKCSIRLWVYYHLTNPIFARFKNSFPGNQTSLGIR